MASESETKQNSEEFPTASPEAVKAASKEIIARRAELLRLLSDA